MSEIVILSDVGRLATVGDAVFVHGLDGDARLTWEIPGRPDTFWPNWLAVDLPEVRVSSISYEASSTSWRGRALPLAERAVNVLALMDSVDIGQRPLVFVAHSLGGLVIKQALRRATELGSPPAWSRLAKATRGIVFLATPHAGSAVASLVHRAASFLPLVRPSPLIDDLRHGSPQLRELNAWYRVAAPQLGIKTQVYCEGQPVGPTLVVDEASGDPGVYDSIAIPIDNNHISICKPASRESMLYRRIRAFVSEMIRTDVPTVASGQPLTERPQKGAPIPRVIRVFLSCPFDVARERDRLDDAVRSVGAAFAPHGVHLETWRYDRDSLPELGPDPQEVINRQIPKDYDIYVGIMCRRFGTNTGRFLSGTIEEFEAARVGWERNGRPHILFYFCRNTSPPDTPDEERQREQVDSFRRRYPGLFASFDTTEDLVSKFERHLLSIVLRLFLPLALEKTNRQESKTKSLEAGSRPVCGRNWAANAAAGIDKTAAGWMGFVDYSSERPMRAVAKIERLFDCDRLLSPFEQEVLLAATYLRTAAVVGGQGTVNATASGMGATLLSASWAVAAAAGGVPGIVTDPIVNVVVPWRATSSNSNPAQVVRTAILAALLRLAELLNLDTGGLSIHGRQAEPGTLPSGAPTECIASCCAAKLTREARVQPGVVTYVLASPGEEWSDSLRRGTALRLEAEWQRSRTILSQHGFALAVAPSEVAITPGGRPLSPAVGDALHTLENNILGAFPGYPHLGTTNVAIGHDESPRLSDLLPLPYSTASGAVIVPLNPGDYEHVVDVAALDPTSDHGGLAITKRRILAPAGQDNIVLGRELLTGTGYKWTLYRDYGDSDLAPQATGIVRPLDNHLAVANLIDDQLHFGGERAARLSAAGLWNDWLSEMWPELLIEKPAPEHIALAYGVLSAAYELTRAAGRIGAVRASAYRNASNWMKSLLKS